jgi:hypothetical protein
VAGQPGLHHALVLIDQSQFRQGQEELDASHEQSPTRHTSLPRRPSGRRVPSNQASLPSALPAATLPSSFRRSPGQRGGHPPARGSRPSDDAGRHPRSSREQHPSEMVLMECGSHRASLPRSELDWKCQRYGRPDVPDGHGSNWPSALRAVKTSVAFQSAPLEIGLVWFSVRFVGGMSYLFSSVTLGASPFRELPGESAKMMHWQEISCAKMLQFRKRRCNFQKARCCEILHVCRQRIKAYSAVLRTSV